MEKYANAVFAKIPRAIMAAITGLYVVYDSSTILTVILLQE